MGSGLDWKELQVVIRNYTLSTKLKEMVLLPVT